MTKFALTEKVSISTIHEGKQLDIQVGPGEVDLPDPVGELLSTQGVATRVTSKKFTPTTGSAEE